MDRERPKPVPHDRQTSGTNLSAPTRWSIYAYLGGLMTVTSLSDPNGAFSRCALQLRPQERNGPGRSGAVDVSSDRRHPSLRVDPFRPHSRQLEPVRTGRPRARSDLQPGERADLLRLRVPAGVDRHAPCCLIRANLRVALCRECAERSGCVDRSAACDDGADQHDLEHRDRASLRRSVRYERRIKSVALGRKRRCGGQEPVFLWAPPHRCWRRASLYGSLDVSTGASGANTTPARNLRRICSDLPVIAPYIRRCSYGCCGISRPAP